MKSIAKSPKPLASRPMKKRERKQAEKSEKVKEKLFAKDKIEAVRTANKIREQYASKENDQQQEESD